MTQTQPSEEDRYWSLVDSTQKHHYPDFVRHLSEQQAVLGEDGRAAIISFLNDATASIRVVNSSAKLRECLESSDESHTTMRRLVILEGLPKSFVQVLGVKFRVPPNFFSAHWTTPGSFLGTLVNRTPRHYDHQHRFHLSFTKLYQAQIESQPKDSIEPFYSLVSSIPRIVSRYTIFGEADGPLMGKEHVSFWGSPRDGGWEGMICPKD